MSQWKGHDRHRDLPMLGVDPDAKSDWEPVDNGLRPDNRDPQHFVIGRESYDDDGPAVAFVGARPDIGPRGKHFAHDPEEGRELMEYHRELALAQNMSVKSDEMVLRTVGL